MQAADYLLLALIGVIAVSTFTHDWQVKGPTGVPPMWRLLAGYLTPALIYWVARQSRLTQSRVEMCYKVFAIYGLYLGVTGIAEVSGQWWAVFPKHIADPTIGLHFGRARGPMVQLPTYGLYLAICMLAAWIVRPRLAQRAQWLVLASMPIMLAGIVFSYTRSVWMGTGLGVLILFGMTLRGRTRNFVLGGMVAGALLVGLTKADSIIGIQREGSFGEGRQSAYLRTSFTYVSWQMFLDRPIWGCGFGQFPIEKYPYLADRSTEMNLEDIRTLSHHNTLLSLLTETGIMGLGLFLSLLACWARDAWRLWRSPVTPPWASAHAVLFLTALGVYAVQLLFHELTYSPMENSIVFFLAGIASGLRSLSVAAPKPVVTVMV
jgi:O-antigen ligase